MDVRNSRPEMTQAARPSAEVVSHHGSHKDYGPKKVLILLLAVATLMAIGMMGARAYSAFTGDRAINHKEYQALFLSNGQVYFGKISNLNGGYVTIKDIYYLQVQQQVQPKDSSAAANATPQISLAKLGGELHGPEDSMQVAREQVLFWENLKSDGKVSKAISDSKQSGK